MYTVTSINPDMLLICLHLPGRRSEAPLIAIVVHRQIALASEVQAALIGLTGSSRPPVPDNVIKLSQSLKCKLKISGWKDRDLVRDVLPPLKRRKCHLTSNLEVTSCEGVNRAHSHTFANWFDVLNAACVINLDAGLIALDLGVAKVPPRDGPG